MMTASTVALMSFAIAFLGTPLVRQMSRRLGILDIPNERSSHVEPTPRSGGLAIVAGMLIPLGIAGLLHARAWRAAAIAILFTAIVGLIDDFRPLGASIRFAAHCAAAGWLIWMGGFVVRALDVPWNQVVPLSEAAIPLTAIFIVGLTNAYNFMDGINGIASIEAVVAGSTLVVLFSRTGDVAATLFAIATAGAAAGFLPWNFPKASIFMGDVGSGALGIAFALLTTWYASIGYSIIAAILPLMPFILDTAATLVLRMARRERLHVAHRSHFYQRLNSLGWSHAQVSSTTALLAVGGGVVSVFYDSLSPLSRTLAVSALFTAHVMCGLAIAYRDKSARTS